MRQFYWYCLLLLLCHSVTVLASTDGTSFRETFELSMDSFWNQGDLKVQDYISQGSPYGHILRASYRPNHQGSPRLGKRFSLSNALTHATLSFDFKLHSQFEFVRGGKMHGLVGGTATTGCKPIDPKGFSVRMMWRSEGEVELYLYHQDRQNTCGDSVKSGVYLERGKWYRANIYVKRNSAINASDGIAALYLNGKKVAERRDLKLVADMNTYIDAFAFSTFYGGSDSSWSPSTTTFVYYDNFSVRPGLVTGDLTDTQCEIFNQGIYHVYSKSCCANSCGSCGGTGCGALPGGAQACCTGAVSQSAKLCTASDTHAPCRFP